MIRVSKLRNDTAFIVNSLELLPIEEETIPYLETVIVFLEDIDKLYFDLNNVQNNLIFFKDNLSTYFENNSILFNMNLLKNQTENSIIFFESLNQNLSYFQVVIEENINSYTILEEDLDLRIAYISSVEREDILKFREPIKTSKIELFQDFKRISLLAPSFVVLIILFLGLLFSNVLVSQEIFSSAYFRNLISPVNHIFFLLSFFLVSSFLILIQAVFLFIILDLFFGIDIFSNFFSVLFVSLHTIFIFVLIGIILAFLFNSTHISILVTSFVILFFFLLSNTIFPIELMPEIMYNIVSLNPLVISETLYRKIFFFGYNLSFFDIFIYYIYIIILTLIAYYLSLKKTREL